MRIGRIHGVSLDPALRQQRGKLLFDDSLHESCLVALNTVYIRQYFDIYNICVLFADCRFY